MAAWKRWLRYAQAKLNASLRSVNADLDEAEGRLAAEREGKPWLGDERPSPSYEDVKARIEDADTSTPPPTPEDIIGIEEQQRAASERLAEIRRSVEGDKDR